MSVCSINRLPFAQSRNSAESLMNAIFYLFIRVFQMCMMYDDNNYNSPGSGVGMIK